MTSQRSTNVLLLIIALLLGVIALQLGSRPLIEEAVAQASTPWTGVAGCYQSYPGAFCKAVPLSVDALGQLVVSPVK